MNEDMIYMYGKKAVEQIESMRSFCISNLLKNGVDKATTASIDIQAQMMLTNLLMLMNEVE